MICSFDAYDWISQYHNITSFNNMHLLRKFFWCFDTFDWISQYHRITSYVIFHYLMEYHNITMSHDEITYLCWEKFLYCFESYDWISQYHNITMSHWKITPTSSGNWFIALMIMVECQNITISQYHIRKLSTRALKIDWLV